MVQSLVYKIIRTVWSRYGFVLELTKRRWESVLFIDRQIQLLQPFLETFEETLASVYMQCDSLICVGDFNINLLDTQSNNSVQFDNLLNGIGLRQIVNEPTRVTHSTASLIDLIIIDNSLSYGNCTVKDISNISDHFAVMCDLDIDVSKIDPIFKKLYRDFKSFNLDSYEK